MDASCDTLVALGAETRSGRTLFAKNSDRPSTECQPLESVPPRRHAGREHGPLHVHRDPPGARDPGRAGKPPLVDLGVRARGQRVRRGDRERGAPHARDPGRDRPPGHGPPPARPRARADRGRRQAGDHGPPRAPRPGGKRAARRPPLLSQQLHHRGPRPPRGSWRRQVVTGSRAGSGAGPRSRTSPRSATTGTRRRRASRPTPSRRGGGPPSRGAASTSGPPSRTPSRATGRKPATTPAAASWRRPDGPACRRCCGTSAITTTAGRSTVRAGRTAIPRGGRSACIRSRRPGRRRPRWWRSWAGRARSSPGAP